MTQKGFPSLKIPRIVKHSGAGMLANTEHWSQHIISALKCEILIPGIKQILKRKQSLLAGSTSSPRFQ